MVSAPDERLQTDLCFDVKGRACWRRWTKGCVLSCVATGKIVHVVGTGREAACWLMLRCEGSCMLAESEERPHIVLCCDAKCRACWRDRTRSLVLTYVAR